MINSGVLRYNRSGWHVVKHPLSLRRKVHRRKKTTKMKLYVARLPDLLQKMNKRIKRHTCHSEKLFFLLGHLLKLLI